MTPQCIYFLILRLPPQSTLFPYTTLFRSLAEIPEPPALLYAWGDVSLLARRAVGIVGRSEEHTSELQSHSDLVCRLLLEKKNKIDHITMRKQFIQLLLIKYITYICLINLR